MMTKKHFVKLAAIIRDNENIADDGTGLAIAEDIADMCAAENPQFDRRRFLEACGVEL